MFSSAGLTPVYVGGREALAGGIENKRALIRVEPTECIEASITDTFVYNGKFRVTKGKKFFREGQLAFPARTDGLGKRDGSYRTLFGPCCAHTGLIYSNSDANVRLAFRRLTSVRKPERPGYDDLLVSNQEEFVSNQREFIGSLCDIYSGSLYSFHSIEEAAREHHDDPHVKRALRIQSWAELNESGERFKRLWLTKVLYKMKRDEIARPGKVPRMIGDLGVAASLQGFVLTKLLKMAQEENPLHVNGGVIAFCSTPAMDRLQDVFDNLLSPAGKFYMVYFSDDSCFSFRHRGKVRYYNLDISKCDASHGPHMFDALLRITPLHLRDYMKILIEQCKLPIEIRSISNPRNKVLGSFSNPTLFSGSTLTTLINNLANIFIGLCLSRAVAALEDREYADWELARHLEGHVEKCGYIVTGFEGKDLCVRPEDIQFLKYSPALDTEQVYRPVLNLGVLLRASGTCHGDLPGPTRSTIETRAREFQFALLHGMYPRSSIPFLESMKDAAGRRTNQQAVKRVQDRLLYRVDDSADSVVHHFTDEDVLRRYDLTPLEYSEFQEFSRASVYEHSSSTFITKILKTDYGLSALQW